MKKIILFSILGLLVSLTTTVHAQTMNDARRLAKEALGQNQAPPQTDPTVTPAPVNPAPIVNPTTPKGGVKKIDRAGQKDAEGFVIPSMDAKEKWAKENNATLADWYTYLDPKTGKKQKAHTKEERDEWRKTHKLNGEDQGSK